MEQLLGARPPVVAQQAAQRKESFTLKLVWLRDHKSNNLVHIHWLPLLRDFAECRALSWGSAMLPWTYQSLCLAAQRGVTDIVDCTLLLMSWIYQRFSQWCLPDREVYQYLLTARLVGLQQQSRDQHRARVLYYWVSIDRLRFDEFAWRVYDDPALQTLCPHWFREEEECGTWLSVVPIVCFNIVRVHHVDRVKRYLTTTGRGEDVWWPERLQQWYDGWRQRFEPDRRIIVHYTFNTRPTGECYNWWRGVCRVRHLSGQEVLEDPRLVELPPDVQPTASQLRDDLTFSRGVPDRRRRAREVREDTRRPARRERGQRERRPESEEKAEFDRHEDEGDVPVHGVASPTGPTPPPPPPPSEHRAWHSSGSGGQQVPPAWDTSPQGWHEGGPSGTQQEEDVFLDEILIDDAFLPTVQSSIMDRLAESFRTGREVGIADDHHLSAPAQTSYWMPQISPASGSSYGTGLRPGSQYVTPPPTTMACT
ncbi:hypothetical protein Ahy_B05g075106 [Arachis hypogaea]|uniref:Aminotransferase-like plant mobile domain-containing protein n=1 Tax=Arachis hypogaea TaxID=3818 RepID=A0A444Z0J7_ARAHY|nr:hypothetical protein Ahy_B05g075106 [Arachis hypogaea]